jgi:RimJ/RimL family protein N-acetyltransferase
MAAFESLSAESRYRRFFSPLQDLSDTTLDYLTRIDYRDHFAWVALDGPADAEHLVGVARYVRLDDPTTAEAAVTVSDPYQGRGLGHLLLAALVDEARQHGITCFKGDVLAENEAMQSVLERAGAQFALSEAGVIRFELDLPAAIDRQVVIDPSPGAGTPPTRP